VSVASQAAIIQREASFGLMLDRPLEIGERA
jgi:hypothetical protein